MANLDGTNDIFNSLDVIERIEQLKDDWTSATGEDFDDFQLSEDDYRAGLSDEDARELSALIAFKDETEGYVSDWQYGETFISDDYFKEYARDFAEDIGAIDPNATWPLNHIDWEAAADDLKMDYASFDFMGTTYWARA